MVLPHDVSTKKSCVQSASSSGGMEDKRANKNMMLSSSNTGEGGSACGDGGGTRCLMLRKNPHVGSWNGKMRADALAQKSQ
jgi:hypothetical protein